MLAPRGCGEARGRHGRTPGSMTFLTPGLALLAAGIGVPTLILLHVLRLRRLPQRVPATLLWRRSVQDLEANVPFQRLRPSWLLVLQLLALLCAALAAGQPVLLSGEAPSSLAIVLDARARMNAVIGAERAATDSAGVPSPPVRFDRAKEAAKAWVRARASDGTPVHLVVARARPSLVASGSSRMILDAIDRLAPTDEPGEAADAMALAAQVAPDGEIRWFGDPDGARVDNAGLTLLSAQRGVLEPGTVDLLVGAVQSGREPIEVPLVVTMDGAVMAARVLRIPAAHDDPGELPGRATALLRVPARAGATIEARLMVEDALARDDSASLRFPPATPVRIALAAPDVASAPAPAGASADAPAAPGAPSAPALPPASGTRSPLLGLLRVMDAVEVVEVPCDAPRDVLVGFDLVVADGCVPSIAGEPDAPPWLVFAWPDGASLARADDQQRIIASGAVPGAARSHPLLQGVPPFTIDVAIPESIDAALEPAPPSLVALLEDRDRVLAWIDPRAPGVRFLFPLDATEWSISPSWVMTMQNAVLWLVGDDSDGVGAPIRTGHASRVLTERRDGTREWISVPPQERVGEVELRVADGDPLRLAVSLLDERQSDLRLAPAPEDPRVFERPASRLGADRRAGGAGTPRGVLTLWPWLATAALAFLLAEWCVYLGALNRRA